MVQLLLLVGHLYIHLYELFLYKFIYLFFFILFSKFSPAAGDTLTVEGVDGYYQETKWVIPSKTSVIISGETKTGTILSVGLPLRKSFIDCVSGINLYFYLFFV
jgi:hypothetical protein